MTSARFDLIYVEQDGVRTMSAGFVIDGNASLVGPFPAKESGPLIVEALLAESAFGFENKRAAELAYATAHFHNMSRGTNDAGQDYPYRVGQQ